MTDEMTTTKRPRRLTARTGLIAAAMLAVGAAGGAAAIKMNGPSVEMAPANPVAIRSLSDSDSVVTVRGRVAEVYGPRFVLADGSGRALIETGPRGDGTGLVSAGAPVTVQGRFHNGSVHASFLVDASGKVTALAPMGPPHGPRHEGPRHGPDGPGEGPEAGLDGPPPPPPGQQPAAVPAAAQPGAPTVVPTAVPTKS